MSVTNEIIKFIAGIELDPKDKETFTKALKESNDICAAFRHEIAETEKEIEKLAKAGKKDSEEFRKLSSQLEFTKSKLQSSSKEANKYATILGINSMSYNQLKNHATKLRREINSLHKESDPENWEKYNNELIATEKRMKEVKAGVEDNSSVLGGLKKIIGENKGVLVGLTFSAKAVSSILLQMTEQSQVWGDKWAVAQAKFSAGWNQLISRIGQGKNVIKASVADAMAAAEQAQLLQDELFERNNSLRIAEAQSKKDIAEQRAIVNDATKSSEERLAAMEKILDIEGDIAATKLSIAQQEDEVAFTKLSDGRTGLTRERLALVVNAYNENRDAFKQAEEYNALLEKRDDLEKTIALTQYDLGNTASQQLYNTAKKDLPEVITKLGQYSEATKEYASILRQYNLANDDLVKDYVDAQVHIIEATSVVAETEAAQGEKRSSLMKQMSAEQLQATEDAYNARIKAAEDAYGLELIKLKEQLGKKEISEAEYQAKSYSAEITMLVQKRAINEAYGKDVSSIDQTIADKRLEIQKTVNAWMASNSKDTTTMMTSFASGQADAISKEIDSMMQALQQEIENDPDLASNPVLDALAYKNSTSNVGKDARLADLQNSFDAEMASLENLHEYKLISEEEYLARKKALTEDYAAQERAIQTEGWTGALESAMNVLDGISQAMSAAQEAEYANLDAWKAKELAAAGENAEKREQIEAEYEAKKLDLQKKYADADMGIQIAQSIAAGAMAMIQAWNAAGGNPVLAGVIMGLIGATTTAQVATIIAQRNAIKSTTAGGSGDSSSGGTTTVRTVNGYSEGGYTGHGARLEVAGVVHRGEYVVPQPEMRDPAVMAMVASIEARRRRRTSANALPGFAEGGYTGAIYGTDRHTTSLLEQILKELRSGNENPTPAYVVLSELYAKQELEARMKKQTSLG